MEDHLSNKSDIFFKNGNYNSNIIYLDISRIDSKKSFIIDTININTPLCSDYKVKLDYNINIFKGIGVTIPNITFQVFKTCEGFNYNIPVNTTLSYSNNNLDERNDLINFTVYDDVVCGSGRCSYMLEVIV